MLCLVEGLSAAAAARMLGVPEGTVKSRLARARQRLSHGLAGSPDPDHAAVERDGRSAEVPDDARP